MSSISHVRKKPPRAGSKAGPRRLRSYLPEEILAQLHRHLDWLQRLEALWQQRVGMPLAGHTRPVSYRCGRLLVQADSAVWADQLRQQRIRLLQTLRQDPTLEGLREVSVRVVPAQQSQRRRAPVGQQVALSSASAALIRALADDVEDPELRAALQRLGASRERRG